MIRFDAPARQRQFSDASTIPLINVVFLMLIFLLVAGTLRQYDEEGIMPPQAVREALAGIDPERIIRIGADGALRYAGATASASQIAAALAAGEPQADTQAPPVWLLADRSLDATQGLDAIRRLQSAGVRSMRLIVSLQEGAE